MKLLHYNAGDITKTHAIDLQMPHYQTMSLRPRFRRRGCSDLATACWMILDRGDGDNENELKQRLSTSSSQEHDLMAENRSFESSWRERVILSTLRRASMSSSQGDCFKLSPNILLFVFNQDVCG